MNWQEDIPSSKGKKASYSAQMCNSENDINALYHFNHDPGGFNFYRSQISASVIWPMAVLLDVEVLYRFRRQGVGTQVVQQFVNVVRRKGASLGFLRVGWEGGLSERDCRVEWYQRLGWHLLQNPIKELIIPFMFREL